MKHWREKKYYIKSKQNPWITKNTYFTQNDLKQLENIKNRNITENEKRKYDSKAWNEKYLKKRREIKMQNKMEIIKKMMDMEEHELNQLMAIRNAIKETEKQRYETHTNKETQNNESYKFIRKKTQKPHAGYEYIDGVRVMKLNTEQGRKTANKIYDYMKTVKQATPKDIAKDLNIHWTATYQYMKTLWKKYPHIKRGFEGRKAYYFYQE